MGSVLPTITNIDYNNYGLGEEFDGYVDINLIENITSFAWGGVSSLASSAVIDWGDGSPFQEISSFSSSAISHTYIASAQETRVRIWLRDYLPNTDSNPATSYANELYTLPEDTAKIKRINKLIMINKKTKFVPNYFLYCPIDNQGYYNLEEICDNAVLITTINATLGSNPIWFGSSSYTKNKYLKRIGHNALNFPTLTSGLYMGPKASSAMGYGWFYNCNNLEFIGERAFNFQNLTGYLYAFGQTGSYQTYGTFGCSNLPSKIRTYSKDFIYAPNASYISYSISENDPAIYGSFVNNRANFLGGAFTARGSQTFAFGVSSSKSLAQNGAFYNNNSTFQKESFLSLENSTLQFAGFPFSSANVNFLEGCFTSKDSSFFSIVGHYNFHGGGPIFSPGCFKAEDTASVTIKSTYTGGVFGSFTNNSYYSTVNAGMFDFGPNITLVSVAYAFYNLTQITGALPEWWNRDPAPTDYNNCFYGCTSASNFSSVPSSWL